MQNEQEWPAALSWQKRSVHPMKNFDTFINFFESIVAYHKYYNG